LAISNSILEAKSRLHTTHLDPRFMEVNDANCKDDAPTVDLSKVANRED